MRTGGGGRENDEGVEEGDGGDADVAGGSGCGCRMYRGQWSWRALEAAAVG